MIEPLICFFLLNVGLDLILNIALLVGVQISGPLFISIGMCY